MLIASAAQIRWHANVFLITRADRVYMRAIYVMSSVDKWTNDSDDFQQQTKRDDTELVVVVVWVYEVIGFYPVNDKTIRYWSELNELIVETLTHRLRW